MSGPLAIPRHRSRLLDDAMATPLPLVRLSWIQPIVAVLDEVGAPTERLMRRAGLPTLVAHEPDLLAVAPRIYGFIDAAAGSQGMRDLGLRAARAIELGPLLMAGGLRPRSPLLADALAAFIRLGRQDSSRMRLWLETAGETAILHYLGSSEPGDVGFELVEQFMLELLVRLIGCDSHPPWRPARVELRSSRFPERDAAEPYQETEMVASSGALSIHFPRRRLATPMTMPFTQEATAHQPPPADFVGSLREALRPYLSEQHLGIALAARLAGLEVRTLQRRLLAAGETYQDLIDGLRRETALALIPRLDLQLTEIGNRLGYSDSAHFTRAFKRWTGVAPSTYRREIAPSATDPLH